MVSVLQIDDQEIATFVSDLFRYAEPGEFVSLRGFHQIRRDVPPVVIRACTIERDFSPLIAEAVLAAKICADAPEPAVFAPPICTFSNSEHARVVDLASVFRRMGRCVMMAGRWWVGRPLGGGGRRPGLPECGMATAESS